MLTYATCSTIEVALKGILQAIYHEFTEYIQAERREGDHRNALYRKKKLSMGGVPSVLKKVVF